MFKRLHLGALVALAALALVPLVAAAHHHGHGGHWHGRVWIGVGVGAGYWPCYGCGPYWVPGPVVVAQPGVRVIETLPMPPEPTIVGRNGQDAVQTERDWRACTHEAMTRADAMRDGQVFHRSVVGCMEGRGYSVK